MNNNVTAKDQNYEFNKNTRILFRAYGSHKSWSGFMYERNGICQFAG